MRDVRSRRIISSLHSTTVAVFGIWHQLLQRRPRAVWQAEEPRRSAAGDPFPTNSLTPPIAPIEVFQPVILPAPSEAFPSAAVSIDSRMTKWRSWQQLIGWCLGLSALLFAVGSLMAQSNEPVIDAAAPLVTVTAFTPLIGLIGGLVYWRKVRPFPWPGWLWRLLAIVAACSASYAAAQINYELGFDLDTQFASAALWLIAIGVAVSAAWQRHEPPSTSQPTTRIELVLLIGIVGLAFLLRVVDLENIPHMIFGDETKYAVYAKYLLDHTVVMPFSTGMDGHWNLYFMITGLFIAVFGPTVTAMRLPSVLMGTFSIVAAYAVARQLWGSRAALIAAALLATFHHHLHFSRVGFNSINDALFTMLVFACLWLGWRTGRRRAWLMAAIALGLSQYFYVAGRLILIQALVLGVFWLITRPRQVRKQALNIALAIGVFLCIFIPIGYFASIRMDDYMGSLNGKNVFRTGWVWAEMAATGSSEIEVLGRQLRDVVTMYTQGTDSAFYWQESVLTPTMTVLAVAALLYFLRHTLDGPYFWLLSSLGLLILFGGVLVISPTAGIHRMMGSDPLLYIAIGVLLDRVWARIERVVFQPRALGVLAAGLIALLMVADARHYFVDYIDSSELSSPEMQGNLIHRYLIDTQAWLGTQPYQVVCVGFNHDHCQGTVLRYLAPQLFEYANVIDSGPATVDIAPPPGQPEILIINPDRPEDVERAEQRYAPVAPQFHLDPLGNVQFVTFEIPATY
jgi:hypothetical protein